LLAEKFVSRVIR